MPQFVAMAVVAIGEYFGVAVAMSTALVIANVALIVGGLAYSSMQRRDAAKKAKDAYNASQVDRMANVVTTVGQRELVMGRVRKAGTVFGRASTGTNKEKFVMCIALAGHEIDAVETIYLNDKPVTLDGSGYVTSAPYTLARRTSHQVTFTGNSTTLTGNVDSATVVVTRDTGSGVDNSGSTVIGSSYDFTSKVVSLTSPDGLGGVVTYQTIDSVSKIKVTWHLGAAGQTVDPDITALFPTDWDASHTASGVAYLVVQCDFDETAFPSGLPAVSAVVRGAKLYDPRTGLTAWSENPALMARHLLTHPQFGKRSSISAAEDARINAAANACDSSATYTVGGVGTTRALFTAGIVIPYGNPAKQALDDICQAMGGLWGYAAGEFFIKAGVYTAPVLSLTDDDLAVVKRDSDDSVNQQPVVVSTHKARADKVNVIVPRVWDAAQDYKQVALTPLVASALVSRDGAWLAHEVTMPAITYAPQGLHVAGIIIRDERDPLTVTLPFKLKAYPLELFDSITLTISRYGWSNKEFIVLGRTWTLDGLIQLTLKETAASIFQMDAAFTAQGYAANTNLPTPWDIAAPANVVVASGAANLELQADGTVTTRVKVSWDAITDASILNGGQVEVQYRLASETSWHSVTVLGSATSVYLYGANPGDVGFVQARTRNPIAVSDWCPVISHTVTGKSAGPGTPTGFTATGFAQGIHLACVPPTDVDLAFLELWRSSDNILAHATKIAWGMQTSYDDNNLTAASGTQYYWVRAVNNTGIAGSYAGPVSAVAGLTSAPNPVTGLTATPIIGGIRLTCTLPSDADLAGIELWENTSNTLVGATLRASGLADHYDRLGLTPANGTYYFWVRTFNSSGTRGSSYVGSVNAIAGQAVAAQIASVTWSTVSGTGRPADGADVTSTILGAAGTSILMNSANLLKSTSGAAGVFIGSGGIVGKDSGGNVTFSIDGTTGAAAFKGDITGGSNINITGSGQFGGNFTDVTSGYSTAVTANSGKAAQNGFIGYATLSPTAGSTRAGVLGLAGATGARATAGVAGFATAGSVNNGVYGELSGSSTGGAAVFGTSAISGGVGVTAQNTGGGVALQVIGPMTINSTTLVTNLNANYLQGNAASAFQPAGSYATTSSVAKALIYQTVVTPSNTTIAGYIKVMSTDGTVGPVAIPYCNLP